ncbi:hypothetical protein [Streptomyces sp. NPDC006324]|uniref:hypothetical protein n=1 Tax=Streptomyces sp. NPDC006324 TaxID=3156751 RepID=UPI0033B2C48E
MSPPDSTNSQSVTRRQSSSPRSTTGYDRLHAPNASGTNADWYRLAVEGGLFSETDRRFLLAWAPEESEWARWICVELQSEWDIMGAGAAGPLGSAACRPEFRMLSLDGNVLLSATTWEHDISTSVLKPHRSRVLREWAEVVADGSMDYPDEPPLSPAARRWLDTHRGVSGRHPSPGSFSTGKRRGARTSRTRRARAAAPAAPR